MFHVCNDYPRCVISRRPAIEQSRHLNAQTSECLNGQISALDVRLAERDFLEEEVDHPGDDDNAKTYKKNLRDGGIEGQLKCLQYMLRERSERGHQLRLGVGIDQPLGIMRQGIELFRRDNRFCLSGNSIDKVGGETIGHYRAQDSQSERTAQRTEEGSRGSGHPHDGVRDCVLNRYGVEGYGNAQSHAGHNYVEHGSGIARFDRHC